MFNLKGFHFDAQINAVSIDPENLLAFAHKILSNSINEVKSGENMPKTYCSKKKITPIMWIS